MLAIQDIHVMITCENYRRLPKTLQLYFSPSKPMFTVQHRKSIGLAGNRVLLLDCTVQNVSFETPKPIDSIRELHGHILGLYPFDTNNPDMNNPAKISRIAFFAEDATCVLEILPDGTVSEVSYHHIGPCWDLPKYKNPDGTRFRKAMYANQPWTETSPTWGFTSYDADEMH